MAGIIIPIILIIVGIIIGVVIGKHRESEYDEPYNTDETSTNEELK